MVLSARQWGTLVTGGNIGRLLRRRRRHPHRCRHREDADRGKRDDECAPHRTLPGPVPILSVVTNRTPGPCAAGASRNSPDRVPPAAPTFGAIQSNIVLVPAFLPRGSERFSAA